MISSLVLGIFTFVQLNCENFFDCQHDSLKQDTEYLEDSPRHWNTDKYWNKLRNISKELLSCYSVNDEGGILTPDLIALCEIENDSVAHYLTKRSPLYNARYEYLITNSPDIRGVDVALLYFPLTFQPINSYSLRIKPMKNNRPTRDILYVSGRVISGDTLHVFVAHSPSRFGGKKATEPYRLAVAKRLQQSIDSIRSIHINPKIIISGDFNDESKDAPLQYLIGNGMTDVSCNAKTTNGAKGTYKYKGVWQSIDHIFISDGLKPNFLDCHINDQLFLLEEDKTYGGVKPFRTYNGMKYNGGFSDHLPLIAKFWL